MKNKKTCSQRVQDYCLYRTPFDIQSGYFNVFISFYVLIVLSLLKYYKTVSIKIITKMSSRIIDTQ